MLQQKSDLVPAARGLMVTAATAAAAVVGWLVGRAALGYAPEVSGAPVGPVQVVAVGLLTGLAAWAARVVLGRRGASGLRVWRAVAVGAAVLSLLGPVTQARGGSTAVLVGLHLLVAAVVLAGFGRHGR